MPLSSIRFALCVAVLASTQWVARAALAEIDTTATPTEVVRRVQLSQKDFEITSRASNDLRLRVLFAQRESHASNGSPLEDAIPLSALIDSARGSSDPLVLELLLDRCRDPGDALTSRCDAVDLAQRWVMVDSQNTVAWIERGAVLDLTDDHKGADEAWARAGRASTFRDPTQTIVQTIYAKLPRSDDPRTRFMNLSYALGRAAATPMLWMNDARDACKREANRAMCAHVADTAFRDADTISGLQFARMLTAQAYEPEWLRRSRQQTEEALMWAQTEFGLAFDADQAITLDDAALTAINRRLEKVVTRGDAAAARDVLREQHLSEAEGSQRYTAYMTKMMGRLHPW